MFRFGFSNEGSFFALFASDSDTVKSKDAEDERKLESANPYLEI